MLSQFIPPSPSPWPIALLLAGLLFQTVAFAVLNTVVPLWMEQFDAATWEAEVGVIQDQTVSQSK